MNLFLFPLGLADWQYQFCYVLGPEIFKAFFALKFNIPVAQFATQDRK